MEVHNKKNRKTFNCMFKSSLNLQKKSCVKTMPIIFLLFIAEVTIHMDHSERLAGLRKTIPVNMIWIDCFIMSEVLQTIFYDTCFNLKKVRGADWSMENKTYLAIDLKSFYVPVIQTGERRQKLMWQGKRISYKFQNKSVQFLPDRTNDWMEGCIFVLLVKSYSSLW